MSRLNFNIASKITPCPQSIQHHRATLYILQNNKTICRSCLTHICLVDFPILFNWTIPFPILGLSGVLFHVHFIFFIELHVSKQWKPWSDAFYGSDLGLHCLPLSRKWDARLIWVKAKTEKHPVYSNGCYFHAVLKCRRGENKTALITVLFAEQFITINVSAPSNVLL